MNRILIPLTLCLVLLAPVGALFAGVPRPGSPVVVLLFPWIDGEAVVKAAGGQVVGPVSAPFALVAYAEDPGFADRLNDAGALGVRDASLLLDLCGVVP